MNRTIQPFVYVVLAWLMAATLAGCALAPPREVPAQTGRVLDEETRLPIEGAIVVFRWQGTGIKAFVDTQTVCYHVESAVTDAEGGYVTAPWKEEFRYRDLSMKQILDTAYKAGYVHTRTDRMTGDQYLRKDERGVKERLDYLKWLHGTTRCGAQNGSEKNRLPLLKALYSEASSLGGDNKSALNEMSLVESIHYDTEILEFGFEEAEKRHLMRP